MDFRRLKEIETWLSAVTLENFVISLHSSSIKVTVSIKIRGSNENSSDFYNFLSINNLSLTWNKALICSSLIWVFAQNESGKSGRTN